MRAARTRAVTGRESTTQRDGRAKGPARRAPVVLETAGWSDYALLDSGNGEKLERYGAYRIVRPEAQALWTPRRATADWASADAKFVGIGDEDSGAAELVGLAEDLAPHGGPRIDRQLRQHLVWNDAGVSFAPRGDVQSANCCGVGRDCLSKRHSGHAISGPRGRRLSRNERCKAARQESTPRGHSHVGQGAG